MLGSCVNTLCPLGKMQLADRIVTRMQDTMVNKHLYHKTWWMVGGGWGGHRQYLKNSHPPPPKRFGTKSSQLSWGYVANSLDALP